MLFALMDEAYAGSAIEDASGNSGSDDSGPLDLAGPMFLDLLKDENDGIAAKHWTTPTISSTLEAAVNRPQSDRLKQSLKMAPHFVFRNSIVECQRLQVRKRLSDFILAAFQRSPDIIALLKKPITDRLWEAHDNPAKTELALHLCWAVGEHGAGGIKHKDVARELFKNLELLLYENQATSLLVLSQEPGFYSMAASSRKSSKPRLLCFVVTANVKLATCHDELLPRAHVSLAKVAHSRTSDRRV